MLRTKLQIGLAASLTFVIFLGNYRLRAVDVEAYRPGHTGPDVLAQLDALDDVLDEGAAESMQEIFPEGYVFTWALYGLAWVQVGMNEPPHSELRARAVAEARRAVEAPPDTGEPTVYARGSSQALILRFLIDIDPELAREHYAVFRQRFADVRAGMVPGIREYRKGRDGPADVDSGPILLGYSGPATVVGMGTALSFGDRALAEPILRGLELVGTPHTWDGKKRYTFGLLPVGEAFVVWSKTAQPWVSQVPQDMEFEPLMSDGWLWRWHLVSLALVLLIWLGVYFLWRGRKLDTP